MLLVLTKHPWDTSSIALNPKPLFEGSTEAFPVETLLPESNPDPGLGFRVQGSGFRVQGLGFRV